jgi:Zn-finger nucleic acid-binding protein
MISPVCPREGVDLQESEVSRESVIIVVDTCPSCKGVWFDRGELGLLTTPRVELELQTLHSGKDSITQCPRCRGRLVISTFRDVRADVCTKCCGVWLNRAEYLAMTRQSRVEGAEEPIVGRPQARTLEVRASTMPPGVDLVPAVQDALAAHSIRSGAVLSGNGPLVEAELLAPAEAGAHGSTVIGACQLVSLQGRVDRHHERTSLVLHAVAVDSKGVLRAGTLIRARTRGSVEVVFAGSS